MIWILIDSDCEEPTAYKEKSKAYSDALECLTQHAEIFDCSAREYAESVKNLSITFNEGHPWFGTTLGNYQIDVWGKDVY